MLSKLYLPVAPLVAPLPLLCMIRSSPSLASSSFQLRLGLTMEGRQSFYLAGGAACDLITGKNGVTNAQKQYIFYILDQLYLQFSVSTDFRIT